VRGREVPAPLPEPGRIPAPEAYPSSEALGAWGLGRDMQRGAATVAHYARVGADLAQQRLAEFTSGGLWNYGEGRDVPGEDGTSKLAENLSLGEITPAQCWHAGKAELDRGNPGAETFLKELVWREFAYHLLHHTPQILTQNWKPAWDAFPWSEDATSAKFTAWKTGRTGLEFIDAAMRELYVTGTMHNRGRMIVASYLTKHLMTHWRLGQAWFADCLIDGNGRRAAARMRRPISAYLTRKLRSRNLIQIGAIARCGLPKARPIRHRVRCNISTPPRRLGVCRHRVHIPDPLSQPKTGAKLPYHLIKRATSNHCEACFLRLLR